MVDIAKLAIEVDTTQVAGASKQLDGLSRSSGRAEKSANDAAGGMAGMGRKAGMAGVQIQQLVGQVQGGVSPMVALSMQAADLGIVLGAPLLGAVAGITAALAGPFISALIGADSKMDDFNNRLQDTIDNLKSTRVEVLTTDIEMLRSKIGETEDQMRQLDEYDLNSIRSSAGRRRKKIENEEKLAELTKEQSQNKQALIVLEQRLADVSSERTDEEIAATEEIIRLQDYRLNQTAQSLMAIEGLERSFMDSRAILLEQYQEQGYQIADALAQGVISVEEANALKLASDQNYVMAREQLYNQMAAQELQANAMTLNAAYEMFSNINAALEAHGNERTKLGLASLAITKGLMVAQAIAAAEMSYVQTKVAYTGLAAATANPGFIEVGEIRGQVNRAMGYISAAAIAATQFAPAREFGGQVRAGQSYMVGERGPEIITMGGNGVVTPNSGMSSGPQQVNIYNQNGEPVTGVTTEMEGDTLKVIIAQAVNAVNDNIRRGGSTARAMRQARGLR